MHFHARLREKGDIAAIFVHAGAGFHSKQNEHFHLAAVNDAAKTGMAVLKNGGDAIDAVEMAIRVLEDKEITNAGYGSNLTVHGEVECDATMVDHLGRSGAVGAVPRKLSNTSCLACLLTTSRSQESDSLSQSRAPGVYQTTIVATSPTQPTGR
jgi:taspase, threonine aspartase, 1